MGIAYQERTKKSLDANVYGAYDQDRVHIKAHRFFDSPSVIISTAGGSIEVTAKGSTLIIEHIGGEVIEAADARS